MDGAAAAGQPAAGDVAGGSTTPSATQDGVFASSEGGPGTAGAGVVTAAASSHPLTPCLFEVLGEYVLLRSVGGAADAMLLRDL
eukprot:7384799-Prymnesium_polylepis.3